MNNRGARHHKSRLSTEDVDKIRELHEAFSKDRVRTGRDSRGYGYLAEMFGCGASTIRDIVTYKTRVMG